jgi:hypothetical protein
MIRHSLAAIALTTAATGMVAVFQAAPLSAQSTTSEARAKIDAFQKRDAIIQDIGWKLVTSNAPFCDNAQPSIGLQLQDMASFGGPQSARQVMGFSSDFAVQTLAKGSPSASAGLAVNTQVTRIDGQKLETWPAKESLDWERLKKAHDTIDSALASRGQVQLGLVDGSAIDIRPVNACATRFELLGNSTKALADGWRVQIGEDFPGFSYPQEELAAVIAHELAHNLLGHTEWLDTVGRKNRHIRITEREADRLMLWLLANAGYDPAAGLSFMKRWGPNHSEKFRAQRTHHRWSKRVRNIEAELPLVRAQMEASGKADWRTQFRREKKIAETLS